MIKRWGPVVVICIIAIIIILMKKTPLSEKIPVAKDSNSKTPPDPQSKIVINEEKLEINGRKIVGLRPGMEKQDIKKIRVANHPSEEWRQPLEKTLRAQGGSSLKDVKLDKVDSFVWVQDGIALFVESVIVKIRNDKNHETKFRVLVDAQTGKILNNWDRPVVDVYNPKEEYRVPIDPRYHSE